MNKLLLITIAVLMTSWSATTAQPLPDKNWDTAEGSGAYSATDVINIHIAGTGDYQYDRLEVTGTLTPGGATLNIFPCYTPTPGDRFIIFKAPTIDAEFSNPPLIDAGGNFFVLSYEKENGDDAVILTAVAKLFGLNINTPGSPQVKPDYNYMLTVVAEPTIGGTVSPTQATFSVCDEIDIEAVANEGYRFAGWTQEGGAIIDDTEASATTATMPAGNVTLTANFCQLPEPPTATAATGVETNTFTANWEEVTGAVTYTLEVALDDAFTNLVSGYESFEVVGTLSQTVSVFCTATYYYRVKATDACGTSDYSATVSVTATATLTDIDGNVYNTVQIGNQCWMAENLKATRDTASTPIVRYCHNNNPDYCNWYGGLYTWNTLMNGAGSSSNNPSGVQGICPSGWHVPSNPEFTQLRNYVIAQGYLNSNVSNGAGNALKSCRQVDSPLSGNCNTTEHPRWNSHQTYYGFDEFGFSGFPGGYLHSNGTTFEHFGVGGYWWSSTQFSSSGSRFNNLSHARGSFDSNSLSKQTGFSVRCIKN
jgi:uncharacterized protein (TIGR02145 family)/uncharacterized repeat protein (TIGR02543 family)